MKYNFTEEFVNKYKAQNEPFSPLASLTFYRTYSRKNEDGTYETWTDVVKRCTEGMINIFFKNIRMYDNDEIDEIAKGIFDGLWNRKWSPPGRGLFCMGAEVVTTHGIIEALNNCGFVSTENLSTAEPFEWAMSREMLGIGVGFDTKGAGTVMIYDAKNSNISYDIVIKDTRESWAESVAHLIRGYLSSEPYQVKFAYHKIRPAGLPIKRFGGISSGPEPLKVLHERVRKYLDKNIGAPITERTIVDIMNAIGCCVVAGNVRRSSEIALSENTDGTFVDLKNYQLNPERAEIGWASNNSVLAKHEMDYTDIAERIHSNGEPGVIWMSNVHNNKRMGHYANDDKPAGVNPCSEMYLESYELCTLADVYIARHATFDEFKKSLKHAYMYAKSVTLLSNKIEHDKSREIMMRNRRIGISLSGVAQFLETHSQEELEKWMNDGYEYIYSMDDFYSRALKVNKSIRITTVKPAGTTGIVFDASPGIHYPYAPYYIRRVRLQSNSTLLKVLQYAGLPMEEDKYSANTHVVSFPIKQDVSKSVKNVSVHDQLQMAKLAQSAWSDNGVSVTITFNPNEVGASDIASYLDEYQYHLKSVSFLPEVDGGAYAQMPYEEITKQKYDKLVRDIDYGIFNNLAKYMSVMDKQTDEFCNAGVCEVK